MTKSDRVIHSFCIYEIKRNPSQHPEYRWTKFYESDLGFEEVYPEIQLIIEKDELVICSVVIDADNYSVLTTRQFVTRENGIEHIGNLTGAEHNTPPLTHRLEKFNYVLGSVKLKNGDILRYFIEAGMASNVMEFGIRTLIWSQQLSDSQMLNLMRLWDKRSKINPI